MVCKRRRIHGFWVHSWLLITTYNICPPVYISTPLSYIVTPHLQPYIVLFSNAKLLLQILADIVARVFRRHCCHTLYTPGIK